MYLSAALHEQSVWVLGLEATCQGTSHLDAIKYCSNLGLSILPFTLITNNFTNWEDIASFTFQWFSMYTENKLQADEVLFRKVAELAHSVMHILISIVGDQSEDVSYTWSEATSIMKPQPIGLHFAHLSHCPLVLLGNRLIKVIDKYTKSDNDTNQYALSQWNRWWTNHQANNIFYVRLGDTNDLLLQVKQTLFDLSSKSTSSLMGSFLQQFVSLPLSFCRNRSWKHHRPSFCENGGRQYYRCVVCVHSVLWITFMFSMFLNLPWVNFRLDYATITQVEQAVSYFGNTF